MSLRALARDFPAPWLALIVILAVAVLGASFLDGLVRADVAKGIRPAGGIRAYLYVDARF